MTRVLTFKRLAVVFAISVISTRVAPADAQQALRSDQPRNQAVVVELALLRAKEIQLSYRLPASCSRLPLRTPYSVLQMQEMRHSWQPSDGCGSAINGEIVRSNSQCERIVFDVPVQTTIADRVYPAAFPIGDVGVYIHTGIYAPTDACGPVKWRFRSESGAIVYDGTDRGAELSAPATDSQAAYKAVYLSEKPLPPGTKSALSAELPPWIRHGVASATLQVETGYRNRFVSLTYSAPFIVASATVTGGPARQQADVADGDVIRFAFFNPPRLAEPRDITNLRGIIAHEYGHKLQPESLRRTSGDSDNIVNEGGAEYLRWTTMQRLGWFSPADAQKDLNKALNTCLAVVGEQPWRTSAARSHGDAPYACGLTLHVLLLASRQDGWDKNADSVLESFYLRSQSGPVDFGQALECGDATTCRARWAPALLSDTTHFASEIDKLIRSLKLARNRITEAPRSLQQEILRAALMHTMDDDCDGSRGFYTRKNGFEIDMSPDCKTFHDGMLITRANGVDLLTEPLRAARKLAAQCADRHFATLGTKDAGSIRVQCHAFAAPAAHFYELDIRKLRKLLCMSG